MHLCSEEVNYQHLVGNCSSLNIRISYISLCIGRGRYCRNRKGGKRQKKLGNDCNERGNKVVVVEVATAPPHHQ